MNKSHLNYVAINRGDLWYIFERMGKDIPYSLYPLNRHLGKGVSSDKAIRNSSVPSWNIEVIS